MAEQNYTFKFPAEQETQKIISWIQRYFEENGPGSPCVIGISGGKDSSVVAALCAEALGKERVYGFMLPYGTQPDIEYAEKLIDFLGIHKEKINIKPMIDAYLFSIGELSKEALVSLKARTRMCTLYACAQTLGSGRVAHTGNLSEDYVGYFTRHGDGAGDFAPLRCYTATETKAIGYALGLPKELIEKPPSDGLSGKTDEDSFGFSYQDLDKRIRFGTSGDEKIDKAIDKMHDNSRYKLQPVPFHQYPEIRSPQI